ncbi:hypothetical protein LguiA_001286 [Lonicera macranthoides]
MPQAIKIIDIVQGNGGPDSFKQINLAGGKIKIKHAIIFFVKFEALPNGGTISKMMSKCYTVGDFGVKDEDVSKAEKEKASRMYKAVEAYLMQNPNA